MVGLVVEGEREMKMEMVKMLEMLKTALRRGHKKLTQSQQVDREGGQVVGWLGQQLYA